jgi:phenylpropionate dioxygenase-like ring-hydroxylating dioxygenase large terminal subunit
VTANAQTWQVEGWQPVARSAELRAGHDIVAAFVAGRELALWRAASGAVQAWDNRCPHRSVRFTLGQIVGDRLSCAYHGWQYEAGTGRCAAIPAHPDVVPPTQLCASAYPVREVADMVWVALAGDPGSEPPSEAVPAGWTFCRSLPLRASSDVVEAGLRDSGWVRIGTAWQGRLRDVQARALVLPAQRALSLCFLWIDAPAQAAPLRAAHLEARRLRGHIEARTG